MRSRAPWLLAIGSITLSACPGDGGTTPADTDEATGSGTGGGMTMNATQGPGPGDDGAPTGGPDDDGPTDDGPTDDGPTDDGPTDDGPVDTTSGPTGCTDDADCVGSTPFCSGGECVACSTLPDPDAACEALDSAAPLCSGGACVQCTANDTSLCEGETPLCDEGTLQCVGCSYHAECDTGACDLDTGACMPAMPSVWVRPLALNCSNSSGTFALPFCELQEAVDYIEANGEIGTVHFEEGDGILPGAIIPGGMRIAILAELGHRPETGGIDVVTNGAHVYLEGISVTGDAFNVVRVHNNASLWLDRVIVYNNLDYAVDVRSGGALHMRNTVVGSNGRISNLRPAVYVEGGSIDAQFTAIVANFGENDTVASLGCMNPTSATMRNSIVVANSGNSIDCPGLEVDYSWLDTGGLGGSGNVVEASVHPDLSIWFVDPGGVDMDLVAVYGDDFRLTAAGETLFGPIGLVHDGDLPFDIELEPRATTIGDSTAAGAYEVP